MENGSAVVKPLVTRTSDGIEDDTFVKRLKEGAPVAEESVSGTEESASGTEEGTCGTEEQNRTEQNRCIQKKSTEHGFSSFHVI